MKNEKLNNSGELQPYIPAGNGTKSGEYTFKNKPIFTHEENCSLKELTKLLTEQELYFLQRYSNVNFGCELNKAIREGNLSKYDILMKDNIISAINKHKLKKDIRVYRGIKVSKEIFVNEFYNKFINNQEIEGSTICSTSRSIKRAIKAAISNNPNDVRIVFEILLPKGYNALPIEDIALKKSEKEILISKPHYKIKSIQNWKLKNSKFKKIIVKIRGN